MCVLRVNDIVQILPVSKNASITYAHSILIPYFFLAPSHFQIWDGQVRNSRVKLYEPWKKPGQSLQDLIMVS